VVEISANGRLAFLAFRRKGLRRFFLSLRHLCFERSERGSETDLEVRLRTHVHIKYNGNVILCCQDWGQEVVLGNVREQSLADIYNGPLAEHYREKLGERDRRGLKLCERCDWGND